MAEYMASNSGKPSASPEKTSVGPIDLEVTRNQAWMARAIYRAHIGGRDHVAIQKIAQGADLRVETRATNSGSIAEIMAAREAHFSGRQGIGELTATVQKSVSLREGGLSLSDVTGTDLLVRRSLALRGE